MKDHARANAGKFQDPRFTAKGETRARVGLSNPQTLWFNTGTLCNIECLNCYIKSSPKNDALVYLSADEVNEYLHQLEDRKWGVREIGFTGGEPFMNPEFPEMLRRSLQAGYDVLVLTNAMQPMQRKSVRDELVTLIHAHRDRLTFRVSLDHYDPAQHDAIRGIGTFERSLEGLRWLRDQGAKIATAGRQLWDESEDSCRAGYAALFAENDLEIDAANPAQTVLFPEMDENTEVPEITTECWSILGVEPSSVMCASSRMIVKRKGATTPSVLSCTLLPYEAEFELGTTLAEAEGDVALNHPHCAKFCVLGGASCSG